MGLETREHVAMCTALSVEAGSCMYVGFIHFATSAIRWADY